jgi:hypothetical protein
MVKSLLTPGTSRVLAMIEGLYEGKDAPDYIAKTGRKDEERAFIQ